MLQKNVLASAIYQGSVRHRRYQPKARQFRYDVFMMYLDLAELEQVFSLSPFWSASKWAWARFKRDDYFGDPNLPLDQAVRAKVAQEIGRQVTGPVRLLTNLRYFGFIINPISVYYCFDENEQLQAMLLEVTNTPWKERIQYVLDCDPEQKTQRIKFNKEMHVSPFHPMNHFYDWASSVPGEKIAVHMKNKERTEEEAMVFDATLSLKRYEISAGALNKILFKHPFMTMKVGLGIYWQALKIILKGIPFYSHPKSDLKSENE